MAQIDNILNQAVETLKADTALGKIKKWHKVDGMIPSVHPSGSVSVAEEDFEELTVDKDDTTASLTIYVYLQNVNPEAGEAEIRSLAHAVRECVTDQKNRTLGGHVTDGHIKKIKYMTVDASETLLLHAAEITYIVTYFSSKRLS